MKPVRGGLVFALVFACSSGAAPAAADEVDACADAAEHSQALRGANHLRDAERALRECVKEVCPAYVRRDCVQWLQDVQAILPTIVIRATEVRGHDVEGATASVDGAPFASRLDGAARPIDPGPHRVKVVAASGAASEADVVVASGEKSRIVELRFDVALATDGSPSSATPHAEASASSPGRPLAGWILAGVSVVALGAGAVLETTGISDWLSMQNGCATTGGCATSDVSWARARLWYLAPASFAVGAVTGALAVWLLLSHRAPADRAVWHLGVVPEVTF